MQGSLWIDGLLTAGFGIQHSVLATLGVKARAKKLIGTESIAWRSFESLANVVYILIAAAAWQPSDHVVWDIHGAAGQLLLFITCASWLWYWQLHLFEYDCGLAFGSTSLVAAMSHKPVPRLLPWKVGSRRWIRFPVHTAFFGMFLCLPRMTADLLVLGIVLNIYNVIGSILYDVRLVKVAGAGYLKYCGVTGLIWPPIYRAMRGAADLPMPAPKHWDRPSTHLPGLIIGLCGGMTYALLLGAPTSSWLVSFKVAGLGLVVSIVGGAALGRLCTPVAEDWEQQQTNLSTSVALAAASSVISWISIVWVATGRPPSFAYYLPLWFIVQYLGHVFAVLLNMQKWTNVSIGEGAGVDTLPVAAP